MDFRLCATTSASVLGEFLGSPGLGGLVAKVGFINRFCLFAASADSLSLAGEERFWEVFFDVEREGINGRDWGIEDLLDMVPDLELEMGPDVTEIVDRGEEPRYGEEPLYAKCGLVRDNRGKANHPKEVPLLFS